MFCDDWEQASHNGELAHAIETAALARDEVTELGAVLTGEALDVARPMRSRPSTRPGSRSRTWRSHLRRSRLSSELDPPLVEI